MSRSSLGFRPAMMLFTCMQGVILAGLLVGCGGSGGDPDPLPVSIQQPDFDLSTTPSGRALVNAVNYCQTTFLNQYSQDSGDYFEFPDGDEVHIRPPAFVAYTLAVAALTDLKNDSGQRVVTPEGWNFACKLVASLARAHVVNGGYWGYQWQSALWASHAGTAAWILWDRLKQADRGMVQAMISAEADRFLGATPPVWGGPGDPDTKAEEDAWQATVLDLASAMYPTHDHARFWLNKSIQYRLTSQARPDDLENETIYHGRPMAQWISGYNLYEDGSLVNHGIYPDPDYMGAIPELSTFGALMYGLGGLMSPQAIRVNQDVIYKCFVEKNWSVTDGYAAPGGAIFRLDGSIYWPPASGDESERAGANYKWTFVDASASVLQLDGAVDFGGSYFEPLHEARVLADQMAHPDGSTGESLETGGKLAEYNAVDLIASTYLLHWLDAQGLIRWTNLPPDGYPETWSNLVN